MWGEVLPTLSPDDVPWVLWAGAGLAWPQAAPRRVCYLGAALPGGSAAAWRKNAGEERLPRPRAWEVWVKLRRSRPAGPHSSPTHLSMPLGTGQAGGRAGWARHEPDMAPAFTGLTSGPREQGAGGYLM